MRKNTEKVIANHKAGKNWGHKGDSIWTDGRNIWSYGTCLLACPVGGQVILNRTKYSKITSCHQNALAASYPEAVPVSGLPPLSDATDVWKALDISTTAQ